MTGPSVYLTVDLEQDCPPFLQGYRGMEEGFPALLRLLEEERVAATCFCTGEVALRHPEAVRALLQGGHELGCHGMTHVRFPGLDEGAARAQVEEASAVLRAFAPVRSFRAPYLAFPDAWLPLLERAGYTVDCSRAAYKPGPRARPGVTAPGTALTRLRASITPSVLRLPRLIREPWLAALASPVVLFVHPWEFVDLRRAPLPLDCRFATGEPALRSLRQVLRFYRARGARFRLVREAAA